MDKFCETRSSPNGRARNAQNVAQNAKYGAILNKNGSAAVGVVSSLVINLMPSANDCSSPKGPVRVGPRRSCIRAETLRSAQMYMSADTPMKPRTSPAAISGIAAMASQVGR